MTSQIVVLLLLGCLLGCAGPTSEHVEMKLPRFPILPEPRSDLSDGRSGKIYFSSSSPFDFDVILNEPDKAVPTTSFGTLFLPESISEPVPAMVLLHGSGGIKEGRELDYGRLLADHGIAAFVLDYYLPRGVTPETDYMLKTVAVTEFDVVADAYAALEILSTHPAID